MKLSTALLVLSFFVSAPALAHRDRVLPITDDGAMVDVPAEYGRATLQVKFSPPGSNRPPVSSVVLGLGAKQTSLPSCVTEMLPSRSMKDVWALGSWYHDESILPYYINLIFFDHGNKAIKGSAPRFSILFNLRTGKLLKMEAQIVRDRGVVIQDVPVDLAARCPAGELKAVTDTNSK